MPYPAPTSSGSTAPPSAARPAAFGVPSRAADHEWQLFDRLPHAVIATDEQGLVVYWNAAATSLYGWTAAEALGRSILALTPSESTTASGAEIMARLQAGHTYVGEFRVRRKSGESFYAMVSDTPIFDAAGRVTGVLGMSWDLSEQKAREAELRAARTAAEHANLQKTEFLAMLSHEVRTPLSAILGYDELLASGVGGKLSAQHQVYVERIRTSSYHLREVIDQILSLSRILAGKEELRLEPVTLGHFVRETAALVEPGAAAKGLLLRVLIAADDDVVIETDSGKLRQVLLNLLANAVKFTARGHVELVTTHDGDDVVFEVRDTGVGFDPAEAAQLFEPFYRAASRSEHAGSGLGLAIVDRLVGLLGGAIDLHSEPGVGSTFRVRIPCGVVLGHSV